VRKVDTCKPIARSPSMLLKSLTIAIPNYMITRILTCQFHCGLLAGHTGTIHELPAIQTVVGTSHRKN
jgi:hypothetical protein